MARPSQSPSSEVTTWYLPSHMQFSQVSHVGFYCNLFYQLGLQMDLTSLRLASLGSWNPIVAYNSWKLLQASSSYAGLTDSNVELHLSCNIRFYPWFCLARHCPEYQGQVITLVASRTQENSSLSENHIYTSWLILSWRPVTAYHTLNEWSNNAIGYARGESVQDNETKQIPGDCSCKLCFPFKHNQ